MAREGLLHGVRAAIQQARRTREAASTKGVRVKSNGGWHQVDIDVFPLSATERPHFLVLFDDKTGAGKGKAAKGPRTPSTPPIPLRRKDQDVTRLQQELASSRAYLQSIIQELEAANEELQSANEEVLSANEELQSTNEELDTAKEELQSTNEELNTVNDELHGRNDELGRVNSDLMNLLGSVHMAIVIVAADLRVRRFTPMAERVLNLLPADIGRPIGHIKPNIDCPELEELILSVMDTVTPLERDVQDLQGNWYSLRIRPYKNAENRIDGAVVTLFDTAALHARADSTMKASDVADAVLQMVRQPMVVLDRDARVVSMNEAFCATFGVSRDQADRRPLAELGNGEWNTAGLRAGLEKLLDGGLGKPVSLKVELGSPAAQMVRLTGRRVDGIGGDHVAVVAVEPIERS